ncbi:hypothetical protein D3C78_355520 [compost metagenome]
MKPEKEQRACTTMIPVVSALAMAVWAASAGAFEIDTGNPDLAARWDNTVRYNAAWRVGEQDQSILNTPGAGNSDRKFDRGDQITNRIDLLSEFDLIYKENAGLRVSAQAWYDEVYDDREAVGPSGYAAYPRARYSGYTERWSRGPSGEFLDAFVFGRFNAGDVETHVKAGQHNLYWGESLFSFVHGVSYAQGPVDVRKSAATPGIEAKELYKPLNQLSFTSLLSDTLSVSGQYFLDWKPSPLPDGGTYWATYDFVTYGGGTILPPEWGGQPFVGANHKPDDKRGDWGVMARWSPQWLGGSLGFYHRKYTDKLPLFAWAPDFSSFGLDYLDKQVTLTGMSLSKNIGGVAVGAEIAHRSNTGLLMGGGTTVGAEPIGDTWHGLINVLGYAGKTALFDSMAWMGELTYSRLDDVKKNAQNFNSVDYGCAGNALDLGCATKDAVGIAVKVEPMWMQVVDGVDLSMPIFYTTGIDGVSPVLFGGYEGNGSYSVGLTAIYQNQYNLALAYNGAFAKHTSGPGDTIADVGGIGYWWDRENVSLTFKTTF